MPPLSRFYPASGKCAGLGALYIAEGLGILCGARRIGLQELGLGNGKAGPDHRLSKVMTVDGDCRNRPTIAGSGRKLNFRIRFTKYPRSEILRGLAALPTGARLLAKLFPFERIDAEQAEVGGHGVAVERPGCGIETRFFVRRTAWTTCGQRERHDGEDRLQATISMTTRSKDEGSVDTRKGCSGSPVWRMLTFVG